MFRGGGGGGGRFGTLCLELENGVRHGREVALESRTQAAQGEAHI